MQPDPMNKYLRVNAYSDIFCGVNNCLTGSCSSVLGGQCNCDNGHSFVGIFGCQVVANTNNAFFANNFVATGMSPASTGIAGELYSVGGAVFIFP